jgi:arylsulfatase A-like enzyme
MAVDDHARDRGFWLIPLAGGIAAWLIGTADGLLSDLSATGAAVLGLRASGVGLLAGLVQQLATRGSKTDRRAIRAVAAALLAAPWSLWVGYHLAQTATLRAALSPGLALALPIAVLLPLLWAGLILHSRLLARGTRPVTAALAAFLAIAMLIPMRWLSDLHQPLALTLAIGSWLCLELALTAVLARPDRRQLWWPALFAAALAPAALLMPVPLADAFQAADRGTVAGPMARAGRTQQLIHRADPDAGADRFTGPSDEIAAGAPPADAVRLPRATGRSVVLITIDALRADRMAISGYHRPITPGLDAFAREAIVFTSAYSPAPTSSFSVPALHTGIQMEAVLRSGAPLPPMLADRLGAAGYETIGLYPGKIFSAGPELMGRVERDRFGFATTAVLEMEARADAARVRRAVREAQGRPVFLWAHFYDPHLPYECHGARFGERPKDCYDAEIAHLDAALGELLPWLATELGDPVVAIAADHGEAFGEHGRLYHSTDLYDEQIRVPLLIRVPGVAPRRVSAPVSIADLPATLIGLTQKGGGPGSCPGTDLRPLMIGDAPAPPVTAAIGDRRAIVAGSLKLICNGWPDGPCALYDLAADPGEARNLIAERADDAGRLLASLERLDRAEIERLEAALPRPIVLGRLGRAETAPALLTLARDPGSSHAVDAAQTLALLRREELAQSLASLHGSTNDEIAAWACVGSALLDEPCPSERLALLAGDPTPIGRWCAVALGRLGDRRGLEPLIANLKSDDPNLRADSALALGQLDDPRAVRPLIRLLEIKQSRWAAIEALGQLGDRRAAAPLARLREDDPDQTNRPRYDRALVRILQPTN